MDRVQPSALQPGDPRRIGEYELVGRLGEGGMGRVFMGRTGSGRLVAIKVIRPELAHDESFRQRFRTEVVRARQVPPFCTAEVLDADPDCDPPYLVVEYVDGPTVQDAVTERGPLSAANLHAVAVNMATALIVIHRAGLVHGDLKPSNVLLAPGSPKVIDFGLARPADGTSTSVRGVEGTVPYLSPERLVSDRGPGLTQAADIFAWAGVVVFAGTGRIPFPGESALQIAERIVNDPPNLTGLTNPLRSLVEEALAKDPKDRPTARQLQHWLIARSGSVSSPYPGLAAYRESDTELFFGRTQLTDTLLRRLADRLSGTGLLVVLGASGSGKSSLLQAGLLASLDHDLPGITGSASWPRLRLTPGRYPVRELAAEVARLAGVPGGAIHDEIFADPYRFPIHVLQALRAVADGATVDHTTRNGAAKPPRQHRPRLILVVDQFEELFTVCDQALDRQTFIEALRAAAGNDEHDQTALVVIGVRADFYARLASYPTLAPLLEQNTTVGPMNHEQLREAIEEPARRTGLTLEPGLVEVLLRDIGAAPSDQPSTSDDAYPAGTLPLLSHALRATWARREDQLLSLAGYQAAGGVHRAIAATAEEVYTSLDGAGRMALRRLLLLQLVRIGEGVEPTRRRASITALTAESEGTAGSTIQLLDRLITDRLITVDQATAQITHEALLRAWPRLRTWIDEDRTGLLVRQRLTDAARTWQRENRDPGGLYRGTRLSVARDHLDTPGQQPELIPLARSFLTASIEQELAEQCAQRRRVRRRALATVTLAVLLMISSTTAGIAFQQWRAANRQQHTATALALMFEAESLRERAPASALRMGLAALAISPGPATRNSLVQALIANRYASTLANVKAAAHASQRGMSLTVDQDDKAILWDMNDLASPRPLTTLSTDGKSLAAVAITPDGRTAVTGGEEIIMWNLGDPRLPRPIATLATQVDGGSQTTMDLALSADGRTALVSGLPKQRAAVWDLSNPAKPERIATLGANDGTSVALSANGRIALTGSRDGTARIWDVSPPADARHLATLRYPFPMTSVALNEDGTWALIGSADGNALLWKWRSGEWRDEPDARLTASSGGVNAVALNSSGTMALASGSDGTAVVWDLLNPARPRRLATLTGHTESVEAVELAANGSTALTMGGRNAILWDLDGLPERHAVNWPVVYPPGVVRAMAWRPDGQAALTSQRDGRASLWDTKRPTAPRHLTTLAGHTRPVRAVAWRPDGQAALTADSGGKVTLWDVSDPAMPRPISTFEPTAPVRAVAWRPDGQAVLFAESDGKVTLWDVSDLATPRPISTLAEAIAPVRAVAWRPDGQAALTADSDGKVTLWDVSDPTTPRPISTLAEATGPVHALAWRPDGQAVLTGSLTATAVWDLSDPVEPRRVSTLAEPSGPLYAVAWPDGQAALTSGQGGTVTLWNLTHPGRPDRIATLTGSVEDVVSVAQSPDGHVALISGTETSGSILYDISHFTDIIRDPVARACTIVGHGLSREEWAQHVPGLPFQETCPD